MLRRRLPIGHVHTSGLVSVLFNWRTAAGLLGLLALSTLGLHEGSSASESPALLAAPASVNPVPQPLRTSFNPSSRTAELAGAELKLAVTYATSAAGRLTVQLAARGRNLIENASASLLLADGTSLDLSVAGQPYEKVVFEPVDEAGLGPGTRMVAPTRVPRLGITVRQEVTLYEQGPYFTYRLVLPPGVDAVRGFSYLAGIAFPYDGPGRVTYLSDADAVVQGTVYAYGTSVPVGQGKPLLLQGGDASKGILMAMLDPSDAASTLVASARVRGVAMRWQHVLPPGDAIEESGEITLPRLFVQLVDPHNLSAAFASYRSLMADLYPPAPLPAWFRQQWISWYLYGMDIDESNLKSQVDYIAANLNDVGPWSILVDAGWYVAEGRAGADWRTVDRAKFPSGLRTLVDYAHHRGVKVVLYFSASYLDDRVQDGNWLGLKGIIDNHLDWLVPIQSGNAYHTYYYDYSNPDFQNYLRQVLRDYFVTYGVDGIKIDGFMDSRLAVQAGLSRGFYSPSTIPVLPTTSVYAFIYKEASALRPDVYVESGWGMPAFSAPYYTVARQSDDTPDFGSPYPSPGLKGHVDYALAQRLMLGQRPHLGNFWGDPDSDPVGLEWLDAGLALNAPVVLGFDLNSLSGDTLAEYRSRLTMLRPFSGEVNIPGGLQSETFSTNVGGTTYLAVFNRSDQPKEIRAEAREHGFAPDAVAYDVAARQALPVRGAVVARVEPRTLRLFVVRSDPGLLWTDSSFLVTPTDGGLLLRMTGPSKLPGYAYVATPSPSAVLVNGVPIDPKALRYDEAAGMLGVDYSHGPGSGTSIEIRY